jgi:hypothetical protein
MGQFHVAAQGQFLTADDNGSRHSIWSAGAVMTSRPRPEDPTLAAVRTVVDSINRELFDGRLELTGLRLRWHDGGPNLATVWPADPTSVRRPVLSLHRAWQDSGDHHRLCTVLVHELAHLATRNEPEHHGRRWERCMRNIGVDPHTGSVAAGSPMQRWLRMNRWW